jgi:hypothetical protein
MRMKVRMKVRVMVRVKMWVDVQAARYRSIGDRGPDHAPGFPIWESVLHQG